MIDAESLNNPTKAPKGYSGQKMNLSTIESRTGSSTAPPAYEGLVLTDPRQRRILNCIVGSAALSIWIFAWSIAGIVEGRTQDRIIFSIVTFFSLATFAYRAPVLVAVLYKTPYEAAQKFDAYLLRRRAVCCQYLVALLWGNLACWPAVAIAYTKHVNWLNIAVTVLCAFMWFFNLMAFISSKRFVQAHGYYCN